MSTLIAGQISNAEVSCGRSESVLIDCGTFPIVCTIIVMWKFADLDSCGFVFSNVLLFQVHPIFMLSVADFVLAICWLLGGALWLRQDAEHYFGFCYFLAIITVVRYGNKM